MIRLQVKAHGIAVSLGKTERMTAKGEQVAYDTAGEWARDVHQRRLAGTQNYAPSPPNSTYKRTGKLGANWRWRRLKRGSGFIVSFTNSVEYSKYVVGDQSGAGQAWMHRGRWWLMKERIQAELPKLRSALQRKLRGLWEKGS